MRTSAPVSGGSGLVMMTDAPAAMTSRLVTMTDAPAVVASGLVRMTDALPREGRDSSYDAHKAPRNSLREFGPLHQRMRSDEGR